MKTPTSLPSFADMIREDSIADALARPADKRDKGWAEKPTFVTSFEFEGYIARIRRFVCGSCESVSEVLDGVFSAEKHIQSGSRRLTALGRGHQWPTDQEHTTEVTTYSVLCCAHCIRQLGFGKEVEIASGSPFTMEIPS